MYSALKVVVCLTVIAVTAAMLSRSISPATEASSVVGTRCGWFENPTPANAWLVDRDGEWEISVQGVGGLLDGWPNFKPRQWVNTNGHYGYGCACMKVTVDKKEKRVTKIISSYAKPLSACKKDKGLKGKEPY